MVWSAFNLSFPGSPNHAAYAAPNHAAYGGPNHAAYVGPNHAAYGAPNHAAYVAPNHAAYAGPNHAAYASPNHAAYAAPNHAAYVHPLVMTTVPAPGTGAGSPSGSGFLGGYGPIARFEYATPAALAPIPWVLDFATGDGWPSFPLEQQLDARRLQLDWQNSDWDPALRFWTLPFDEHLTEWLQDLNLGTPAVVAAREFAMQSERWLAHREPACDFQVAFEADTSILAWRREWSAIQVELTELADLMRDDRLRYLEELALQSIQMVPYFVHLMNFDPATKPWTMELMNCATAIGNLVKMQYKSVYRRVRPSTLCPGLTPPWGPPRHPAFPSGHSTVAHLIALFLLSVPGIAQRFGIFGAGLKAESPQFWTHLQQPYGSDEKSPLLWLAWRIARGRERLGLHYRTDSAAGRRLAALVWAACTEQPKAPPFIDVPALRDVLQRACVEWPELQRRPKETAPDGLPQKKVASGQRPTEPEPVLKSQ